MNRTELAERDLILALCQEAGENTVDEDAVVDGFRANHDAHDIAAAAGGDVTALIRLRSACGLPLTR